METAAIDKALLDEWDRRHSWHPFTQMQEYNSLPHLHVERGEGSWLYDTEGRRYLDTNASVWTNVHGHNHEGLNQALHDQMSAVAHSTWLGMSHPVGAALSQKLVGITPEGLDRVYYSDNGSNAVEIALKLSFQYWQLVGRGEKVLAVSMDNAYHGDTFGTMAVSGNATFHGRFKQWSFESLRFPAPKCVECNGKVHVSEMEKSLSSLDAILSEKGHQVACLVLEPWVQGAAGMQLQPYGFVRRVAEICRAYDVHLILDEVFVGFGRMGDFFVHNKEDVTPDFLCLAKGLSAGYLPLAATLTKESIYEAFLGPFDTFKAFYHGHTFTANPLASAVSLKSIELLEEMINEGAIDDTIGQFGALCAAVFEGHENVAEVRQRGLLAAIDLKPSGSREARFPIEDRVGLKVALKAREHGLLLRPLLDTLLLVPPISISLEEMEYLFKQLEQSIKETINK